MAITQRAVTVGTAATELLASGKEGGLAEGTTWGRTSIRIKNSSIMVVYIGGPGVTAATGFPLKASAVADDGTGGELSLENLGLGDSVFGIVAGGTASVKVIEQD